MSRRHLPVPVAASLAVILMMLAPSGDSLAQGPKCVRTVTANVVALQQTIWLNRLGAVIPDGMMYALARDVVDSKGQSCDNGVGKNPPIKASCLPGKVWLREDKRPRPIVLRANEGDCLKIVFTNLLPDPSAPKAEGAPEAAEAGPEPLRKARELAGNVQQRIRAAERAAEEAEEEPVTEAAAETAAAPGATLEPPTTVAASIHVQGMPWVNGPGDDGSFVGRNKSSLVQPGETTSYTLFAEHEGSYLLYSTADDWTNPNVPAGADGGTLAQGLFGSVNIQPSESDSNVKGYRKLWDSEWYRSQVTEQDLCLASQDGVYDPTTGVCTRSDPDTPPVVNYQKLYPPSYKPDPSRSNLPILRMLCTAEAAQKGACALNEIVHTDLTAIITGPDASNFPSTIPPDDQPPALRAIAVLPDRLQPYRELTIIYHESFVVDQAFPDLYADPGLPSLASAADNFGINYGMGGIVSEILANRLGVGPMKDCTECKYEEFFLSSWVVGDPAMVVDEPATNCLDYSVNPPTPKKDCRATTALYPDDPSNVYHSYLGDHVRFRVLHGGVDLHHVHHQHAHQWLHTSNSPNADYTDSQSIGPGSSFTMEMTYYGGGNLNQTVGDSIFHCHFYAHFASGMWSMFRVYDTLETGTVLDAEGRPAKGSRALPDGEIAAGTPIPGVVPMPTLPMAPLPAPVRLKPDGKEFEVQLADGTWVSPQQKGTPDQSSRNPGYPFFIPGIAGRRAPHPPLDFAYACSDNGKHCSPPLAGAPADLSLCGSGATCDPLDGGLPRHLIVDNPANQDAMPALNNSDFSKIVEKLDAVQLAEEGTLVEQIAMKAHSQRLYPSCRPDGNCKGICDDNGAPCTGAPGGKWQCGNPAAATCLDQQVTYVLNGLPPKPGAPYADPCIAFDRKGGPAPNALTRRYRAADIQLDAIFNKEGWHFPQQRMISLWDDVKATLGLQPPAPPKPPEPLFFRANSGDCIEYTLANLVPNVYELDDFQVRTPTDILGQHIHLVKFDVTSSDGAGNGWNYEDGTFAPNEVTERIHAINELGGLDLKYVGGGNRNQLDPKSIKFFGDGPGGTWIGAQATIQRWYSDPIFDNMGACSNNPDIACTLTNIARCGDGTCDVSAGFCANKPQTNCTAATSEARCGAKGECVARHDRTLRTVFTHDHFGPSTHQQAGLYAGLVVEPEGSVWRNNEDGKIFGGFDAASGKIIVDPGRTDGGPTSWQAVIETREPDKSYREFLLELQDSTLTYQPFWVPAFELDGPVVEKQFAKGFAEHCKNRKPWEPCGFCGNDGVCVDNSTGKPVSPAKDCLVPVATTTTNPCDAGQTCQVVVGQLTACTPDLEGFKHCLGEDYDDPGIQPGDVIKSCKLVSGVPSIAWGTSPIDAPGKPGSQEIVTFFGATNNFSFNYRNEPLYPRTTDPFTGKVLPDPRAGDLSYAYSSDSSIKRPNPRGKVCSNFLGKSCAADGDCPSGATSPCQWAGFCSDNYALCSATDSGNAGKVLCKDPTTAQCLGACDPLTDGGCAIAFPYKALTPGIQPGDPFTPLLRAYAGDDIQIRTLTGAHLNPHNFTIQGMNWLMEPSFVDSGWRNSGVMGISEHFELLARVPPAFSAGSTDFLYQPGAAALEQAGGNWGLVRSYSQVQPDLAVLPHNKTPATASFGVCPKPQPQGTTVRNYNVIALTAAQALGGPLFYNDGLNGGVKLEDPDAILLFNTAGPVVTCSNPTDSSTCTMPTCGPPPNKPNGPKVCSNDPAKSCTSTSSCFEPLVLRANAGDCITVTLHNAIADANPVGDSAPAKTVPYGCGNNCKAAQSNLSLQVGFRPQLVAFDAQVSGGANVGLNQVSSNAKKVQTAGPGETVSYTWYAGNIDARATTDDTRYIPVEFGAANLMSADVINHYAHGLIGGLVIEPKGSTGWEKAGTSALVKRADGSQFREFVVNFTDELGGLLPGTPAQMADAINLRSELLQTNSHFASTAACNANLDQSAVLATSPNPLFCAGACATDCDFTPETPMFTACAGESVRFRVLHGGGTNTAQVFEIYGHNWSEAPYMSNPQTNPKACDAPITQTNLWASLEQGTTNLCGPRPYVLDAVAEEERAKKDKDDTQWSASLNTWQGSRMGHGPSNHLDILIAQAGGPFQRTGDYLYRSFPSMHFQIGVWGIFRVVDPKKNPILCGPTLKPDKALKNQWDMTKP